MIIIVGPGQGAQSPGFLAPWLELPGARDLLALCGDAAGVDLVTAGRTANADTIRDTAIAQPLIVAAGILSAQALYGEVPPVSAAFAGHSVGELTAAALSGVLSVRDAMSLVGVRSRAMADAAATEPTSMAAVLTRGDIDELAAQIVAAGLHPSNFNGAGQIVAAGTVDALTSFRQNAPQGVKVVPLSVAGAFHTPYMATAIAPFRAAASETAANDPIRPLYTNRDGSRVRSGRTFLDDVVEQIARPVRWDLCEASFVREGATGLIELAPAGTLAGLARRGMPGVPTVAVKTPDDLDAARQMVGEK